MPEDNSSLSGGVIDLTTAIDFTDLRATDGLQVVSSNAADSAGVQIFGRLGSGLISSEVVSLTGQTPVPTTQVAWERLMKVLKGASTQGDIAVEQVTADLTGTLQSATGDQVVLGSLGVTTDDAYNGLVFRVTDGLGVGSIAKIIDYNGSTKTAYLDKVLALDDTTEFRIGPGVVMYKTPNEIMKVRRPFYNVVAAAPGGVERVFYEKFFWRNDSGELLQVVSVREISNPSGKIDFAVDPTILSVSSVANRLTAPLIPNLSFGRLPQAVPSSPPDLASGQAVGVWLRFTVAAGQSPIRSSYLSGMTGQTV